MKMWISPFLASIPPWWRLLQCIRRFKDSNERVHVQNGFKYVTSIMASMATGIRRIHSPLWMQVVWIIACVVNSSYTSVWDIKMDWGLLKPNSCHFLLRNDIVFYKWTYYVAVIINVALRFAWTLNLANLSLNPQLLIFILALVEAYRRLQWNFFRLENEHLNNCGAYCAIKEIPLPFALMDTMKPPGHEQERQEQQGVTQSHIELDRVATSPTLQGNMPFHPPQHSTDISVGTFYGRRDFENRHEDGELEEEIQKPTRHASLVLNTFDRIRNIRGSDTSSEGSDPEENDEEKLKEIHPITTGNIEHS
ncbi:EXS family-domain-containing protein [Spinellus fusiger]|nr:EXS family-domain-containing protein [Spinellus fusiger]